MDDILRFLDNRLNPLFLRELRQLVRNRFIVVLINLFIAILVLVCMMNVLFQEGSQLGGSGGSLFSALTVVMTIACFLAVVVYTAMTTSSERINGDLMYTSAMKPSAIVFGKAWAGALLTVLLMSITAPFVMLAYLLRGLDIEWVAIAFLYVFMSVQVLNSAAICIFSNVRTKVQMSAILGVGFFAVIMASSSLVGFFSVYVRVGGGTIDLWLVIGGQMLSALAILALFLSGAIVSIAPPTSNRLLPIRLTVTTIYIGSLLICAAFPSLAFSSNTFITWVYAWAGALIPLMLIAVCERDTWSYRIKQSVPKNFLLRILLFPFYTGSPNSLVWVALMAVGVGYVAERSGSVFENGIFFCCIFAFDYCVTALLLRSIFAPRKLTPDKTWTIVMFLLMTFTLGGMLAYFLLEYDSMNAAFMELYAASRYAYLDPFMLQSDAWTLSPHQARSSVVWAGILALPLLAWFVWKVRRFSPFAPGETMTLEQAVAAVREADANPLVQSDREKRRKEMDNG